MNNGIRLSQKKNPWRIVERTDVRAELAFECLLP